MDCEWQMSNLCSRSRWMRVGVVGVGNCASSFIQGLTYYNGHSGNAPVPALRSATIGGLTPSYIQISSAFDVHAGKVGKDVADAIHVPPNNTMKFADVKQIGSRVR